MATPYIDNDRGQMGIDGLGTALRELRGRLGLSQDALARRAELSRNFVAQIERGESVPTVATLSRIAEALGASVGELLGEEAAAVIGDAIGIPVVSDVIAAGPPYILADHVEGTEPLPRTLLRNLGVDPRQAVLVRLGPTQDSMADTIPPGATLLVDRASGREVVSKGIYAVREDVGGEVGCSVKRLVLDPSSRVLILLSDNPAHVPRAIRLRAGQALEELIIGRVVWWAPAGPAGS
jgi:transcriptional regulator with XRE-family HTH domain